MANVMIVCEPTWDLMPLMLFVIAAAVLSFTRLGSRDGSSAGVEAHVIAEKTQFGEVRIDYRD